MPNNEQTQTDVANKAVIALSDVPVASVADQPTSILFVDTKVEDYQSLIADVAVGTKVVILDANKDGTQQVADTLASYSNLQRIQIISHGNVGSVSHA